MQGIAVKEFAEPIAKTVIVQEDTREVKALLKV